MRRVDDNADEMIGQDSFLDVVTNIVGILILLVMVVGMRTTRAVERASSDQSRAAAIHETSREDLDDAYLSAAAAENQVRNMIHLAANTRHETRLREQERTLLNTMVVQAEQDIVARQEQLNEQDKRDFDMRRKRAEAQLTLDVLTREQVALVSQEADVEQVECQPTPLAREITGDETHVLLADDHVALVPVSEFLDQMREDARKNLWRLKNEDVMERTLGPIAGFRLRYSVVKSDVVARGPAGTVVAGQISQLDECQFLPLTTPTGEPAQEALRDGSEFQQHLQKLNPHRTTVTIWTYPGNYDRLRELKRAVRERGFQIAVRPLPPGIPIGASPKGTQSVSE